jgi:hypothetical protein
MCHMICPVFENREGEPAVKNHRALAAFRAVLALMALASRGLEAQDSTTLFVPVVLSTSGLGGSFFTSELVETNRGTVDATVTYTYTSTSGLGSGTVEDPQPLAAGQQRVIPDAIVYLRSLGLSIPSTSVGTLRATFSNLSSVGAVAITVRTTTPVPVGAPTGRAGLAYAALHPVSLLQRTAYLAGLRQSAQDRTNVAVQNAGAATDGSVTLHLTWIPSGGPPGPALDATLAPGGFAQFKLTDFDSNAAAGTVRIDRTGGTAPYYAYAVINDQANSDGSFVTPVVLVDFSAFGQGPGLVLPTVVETPTFQTEIVVSNLTSSTLTAALTCVSSSFPAASFPIVLGPFEQRTYPNFVQALRDAGATGVPAAGATITGALTLKAATSAAGFFLGGRTLNAGGGGRYGVFTAAQPYGTGFNLDTWLYGLRQDTENRTNVALVNTGDTDGSASQMQIQVYDGDTGQLVATVNDANTSVPAGAFRQINSFLSMYAPATKQAYARVTQVGGNNSNVLYAVVNDGAQPGQRSGDGAVIPMTPFEVYALRGAWHNLTYLTTGAAADTTLYERASTQVQTTLDLAGNVFGGGKAGSQTFVGAFAPDGTLTLTGTSSLFGKLSATFDRNTGLISGTATSVPSPNVSSMFFDGSVSIGTGGQPSSVVLSYTLSLKPSGTAHGSLTLAP